jgi:hypothetical protein
MFGGNIAEVMGEASRDMAGMMLAVAGNPAGG